MRTTLRRSRRMMQAIGCRRTRSCLGWRASALDAEEGHWLLCVWRSAHVHLGYGSFAQYYKPRTTQEKLRVAEALEALPRLVRALEAGALSWCAARELTRVALPETEAAWLAPPEARPSASSRRSWRTKPRRHSRRSSVRAATSARAAVRGGCRHVRDLPRSNASATALGRGRPERRRRLARNGPPRSRRAVRRGAQ
jgi:hypothetical protein